METVAVFDYDPIVYAAASVGEERYIVVKHLPSGTTKEFKNRTTFYGRTRDRDGGWLGDLNNERAKDGLKPFPPEHFLIEDKQRVKEDIRNVLHTAKMMVAGSVKAVKADTYVGYLGGKTPLIRLEKSNLLEYKGNRKDLITPLLKDDVMEYLHKHHSAEFCEDGLEADDWCIIRALEENSKGNKGIVITSDKDVLGNPVLSYNPDKPEDGIVDGDVFGSLYLDSEKVVRGVGRLFKYFQVSYGDPVDNYKANSQSDVNWGPLKAYNLLKDCKSDKEAWEAMYQIYNTLYPEPKEIETWRGELVTIDALTCLQEVWDCAHMRRTPDDVVDVRKVLNNLGILE